MSSCIHIGSADTHGANTIRIRTFATIGKKSFTLLYTHQDDDNDPYNAIDLELNMFDLLAKLSTFCLIEEGTYKMWVAHSEFDTSRVIVKRGGDGDVYETQKHNISYHRMADGDVVIFVNERNEMTTDELVHLATNNDPDLAAQKIRDGSNEHDMSVSVVKYI